MEFLYYLVFLIVLLTERSVSYVTYKTITGCALDPYTLYPWLVSIWYKGDSPQDTKHAARYGQGALITHKAVLTGCSPNGEHTPNRFSLRHTPQNIQLFQVFGQRINLTAMIVDKVKEEDAVECDLQEQVIQYVEHPKCRRDPENPHWDYKGVEQLFNFAGFVLARPFPTLGPYFPTLPIPLSPQVFISDISYINILEDYACEIIWFEPRGAPSRHIVIGGAAFEGAPLVKAIPFQSKCLHFLCEERPNLKDKKYEECREFYGKRANATRLCMKPKWTKELTGNKHGEILWSYTYIGAPLVCNGTGYGHVTFIKERHTDFFKDPNDIGDFFFVTTYMRAWPWIMEFKANNTAKSKDFYIERLNLRTQHVPMPERAPIDDQTLQFRRPKLPYGFDPPDILRGKERRSKGTHIAQNPFIGYLVIICWFAIPILESQFS